MKFITALNVFTILNQFCFISIKSLNAKLFAFKMVSIGNTNNIFCYRYSILCIFLGRSFFCCNRCPSLCNAKIFIKSLDIKRKLIARKGGLNIGKTYIFVYLQRRSCCEMNNVKNNCLQFMIHIISYLNKYLSKIMK